MARIKVLVEVSQSVSEAFSRFDAATSSAAESVHQSESLLSKLSGFGLEVDSECGPIPLFAEGETHQLSALCAMDETEDLSASSSVVACVVDSSKIAALREKPKIKVWPNSTMSAFGHFQGADGPCPGCGHGSDAGLNESGMHLFDLAATASERVDCDPFRPAASVGDLRQLLAVQRIWDDGFRGQGIVVGVVDNGINRFYPVIGGHERTGGPRPGTAAISSHGSMCAADILVAAPFAKLLDYPFLAGPNAGESIVAIEMFNAILAQRRKDKTPHLTSNSYGFTALPPKDQMPEHEAYDPNHPLNRKVREVVASGCACFFAAGNCGSNCPSGNCQSSAIGPGRSISAANSLKETITIAAVNTRHERIGYSAQGPGTIHSEKPDLSAYSHFFGNFGPGRPAGGTRSQFDSGTSAACPVAAGVGALLHSAFPGLTPDELRSTLAQSAINLNQPGWDSETGHGVINAGAAYNALRRPSVRTDVEPGLSFGRVSRSPRRARGG